MAERITNIELQAFRGIPGTFTLDLPGGRSCVALGDNGTGKSSIADAVEWYFKGQIEFLKKEGRSDAIRHSGAAEDLQTTVAIHTDGSLGGLITTDTPPQQRVLEVGGPELFMLRGQRLAEFVDKTKGEKWQALAELLGLDTINQLRLDLQYARNALEIQVRSCADELAGRQASLSQLVVEVSEGGILVTITAKCEAAGVQPPASLDEVLNPEWIKAIVPEGSSDERVATLQTALADLREVVKHPIPLGPIESWNQFVDEGKRDVLPLNLYRAADSLLGSAPRRSDQCPLCAQPVDSKALRVKISAALQDLEGAERELDLARRTMRQFVGRLRAAHQNRSDVVRRARLQGVELPENPHSPSDEFGQKLEAVATISRATAEQHQHEMSAWDKKAIKALEEAIPAASTTQEQALVDIGVLHTRALEWQSAMRASEDAGAAFSLADQVFALYQVRQRDYLNRIVQQISQRAAKIYRFLHPAEGVGDVTVEMIGEKGAELSINYFGKKELPPHRVLSESHLNSLGLALFLAMAETFNNKIGFLVLDDVVNSFDREHRGRLAELLANEFGDTQLIILTHDEQFFNRLCVLAPSWINEQFTSWSYESGPRTRRYDGDRLLVEAGEELSDGNRVGAAQKGRRALEEFLQEACEELEALLPFRRGQRNDQRMADEVMKGLRRTLRDRARTMYEEIGPILQSLEADLQAGLNVESHASQGGTSNQEIQDAITRIGDLGRHFTCDRCSTRVWHSGTADASRCKCGETWFPPTAPTS